MFPPAIIPTPIFEVTERLKILEIPETLEFAAIIFVVVRALAA